MLALLIAELNELLPWLAAVALDSSGNVDLVGGSLSADTVKIHDSNDSNYLSFIWNEDDVADRIINFLVNGGDRTLDMNGNLTVESNSIVNQDLTTDAAPTFVELILTPSAAALSAVQGGMFYNSGDDHIYVCTEGA